MKRLIFILVLIVCFSCEDEKADDALLGEYEQEVIEYFVDIAIKEEKIKLHGNPRIYGGLEEEGAREVLTSILRDRL